MKEYIERAITLDTIGVNNNRIWNEVYDIPVADVVEVRHARWIKHEWYNECEACRAKVICGYNYCPNCGARMNKEDEHEAG